MASPATIATIRFGYGLGPRALQMSAGEHLQSLAAPDRVLRRHPNTGLSQGMEMAREFIGARKDMAAGKSGAQDRYEAAREKIRLAFGGVMVTGLARILDTNAPLRERLTWFWADHFTAVGKRAPFRGLSGSYVDAAIRPHVTGRFSDLLKAAVTHPLMLDYLDQSASVGPNSTVGRRRGRGLNENLAREVLELHTLGVGGAYGQDDVRQLAELMTGLSVDIDKGFLFRSRIAEPGPEVVLGKSYGGGRPKLGDVEAALEDIALHPDTGRHLAWKLAVHFVADDPDEGLVGDLARTYRDTDGDLMAVTETLLTHPAAAAPPGAKAKPPFDFIASALLALGFTGEEVAKLPPREALRAFYRPLAAMGQPFMNARGPDGWPEEAGHWITPQGLATRIGWAMAAAAKVQRRVGDPRDFVETALGDAAGPALIFAAGAAETRAEGIGLVLASAEFNRR